MSNGREKNNGDSGVNFFKRLLALSLVAFLPGISGGMGRVAAESVEFVPASSVEADNHSHDDEDSGADEGGSEADRERDKDGNGSDPLVDGDGDASGQDDEEVLTPEQEKAQKNQEAIRDDLSGDEKFLKSVQRELDYARDEYLQIDENLVEIEEQIEEISEETISLKRQISLLNHHMRHSETMIENVQKQISQREGQIAGLMEEIKIKEIEMKELQRIMIEYLQLMYVQRNQYANFGEDEEFDRAIKLLFSEDSVGEALQQNFYYAFLEDQGNELLTQFMAVRGILQVKQQDVEDAKYKMEVLRYQLKQDRERYELQKEAKERLLEDTEGKEEIYRELVEQSRQQQDDIIREITMLRNNVKVLESNMDKFGDYFNVQDYRDLVDRAVEDITDEEGEVDFRWPVQPTLGISAHYRDPSYVGVFGVQHNAVDIPVAQGSAIRAAEDAVVYKATDNGMGYSSIVLAHKGGYMTLYGHISKVGVSAGEKVHRGQIIGLSGGTPGTPGAGYMTTGAHLHFEMFKGGVHMDPLEKLPLSNLPLRSVPEKYLHRLEE